MCDNHGVYHLVNRMIAWIQELPGTRNGWRWCLNWKEFLKRLSFDTEVGPARRWNGGYDSRFDGGECLWSCTGGGGSGGGREVLCSSLLRLGVWLTKPLSSFGL